MPLVQAYDLTDFTDDSTLPGIQLLSQPCRLRQKCLTSFLDKLDLNQMRCVFGLDFPCKGNECNNIPGVSQFLANTRASHEGSLNNTHQPHTRMVNSRSLTYPDTSKTTDYLVFSLQATASEIVSYSEPRFPLMSGWADRQRAAMESNAPLQSNFVNPTVLLRAKMFIKTKIAYY